MAYSADRPARESSRRDLTLTLLASLLLHLLFLPLLPWLLLHKQDKQAEQEAVVYILEDPLVDGQIVDLQEALSTELPPEAARFFSERNRRVERESKARNTGPRLPTRQAQRRKSPSTEQEEQRSELFESLEGPRHYRLNTELPPEWLASLAPEAPSNYLPNIEFGEQTLLNTREYAYAHFFIRMKRQMELVWNPQRILQSTKRAFRPEYRTVLRIVLNRDGSIHRVEMRRGSSIKSLDQEAIRAVHKASPYLNPPGGLIGGDGKISIDEWHFIVNQQQTLF